jgi:hypothetical protein
MFVKAVARGRGVTENRVRTVFQAKMRLAAEAKAMGMVDRIDTFSNVLARLGVDVGASQQRQGQRAENDSPEPQAVTFGKDYDTGKINVLGEWPKRVSVSPELLGVSDGVEIDGDHLTFTCENGTAEYVKDGEDASGNWIGRLVESTYEPGRPPERAVTSDDGGFLLPPEAATSVRNLMEAAMSEPDQDKPDEPQHNPRHRRLALLKHA